MREVRVDRQRVKSNISFASSVSAEQRLKRLRWAAQVDNTNPLGEQGWVVDNVEILSSVSETNPTTDRVYALITEHKIYRIPQTVEEQLK